MSIRGFELTKGRTAANSDIEDNISSLLVNGPEVAAAGDITGVVNGTVYEITKLGDAETMGIDAAYDSDNDVRIHRHISEFYRMAGEGTKLFLCVAPEAKTMKEMIEEYAQTMIIESEGTINYMSVAYNQPDAYSPTYTDGIEVAVYESLAPAQALHEWSWNSDRPVTIILEGRGINGAVASMLDLTDITIGAAALAATHVALCVGQDYDYYDDLTGESQKGADVGTLMGSKAYLPVNRNVAEVETMNLSDATKSAWLNAGLSNHQTVKSLDADLSAYNAKGYIFGMKYTGVTGYRWNDDHTCAPKGVDGNNNIKVSTLAYAATLNKAARMLRIRLLPKVKSTVPVDTETGLLPAGVVKYFEGIGNKAFEQMSKPSVNEISGGETIVDPTSKLNEGDKELKTSFSIVTTGTVGKIVGTINLKTSLS